MDCPGNGGYGGWGNYLANALENLINGLIFLFNPYLIEIGMKEKNKRNWEKSIKARAKIADKVFFGFAL